MFIGYYNIANLVTLLGLVSSVLACFNAMNGNIKMGVVMFLLAGLCDMFDGRIARSMKMRSGREKLFGVQIDTVCDMVSFGLTPVIIGYALGMRGVFDILVFLFFAVCGGVRLAYFNTQAIARPDLKMDHFTGVPIPFICYVLPFLVLLMCFVPFSVRRVILPIAPHRPDYGRRGSCLRPRPVPCGQRHHRLSAFRRYPPYHLVERETSKRL